MFALDLQCHGLTGSVASQDGGMRHERLFRETTFCYDILVKESCEE